jgi:hypothetical protein
MWFSYLPHNGSSAQLDHRISKLRLMLPPLAFGKCRIARRHGRDIGSSF